MNIQAPYMLNARQENTPTVAGRSGMHGRMEIHARRAIVLMIAATVIILASPASRLLIYIFPAMAAVIGFYTARRSARMYMSFVAYAWIFTPFVRRLVDYRAGWIPATAVLLAPFLATVAPLVEVMQNLQKFRRIETAAFVFIPAACLYGCAVGVMHFRASDIVHDLLLWISPFTIALFVFLRREQFSEMYRSVESAMIMGLLLVGLYGLVQFFFLPEWDALWMREMDLDTIGLPEPTLVRVFSVMNSPQILASYLGAGLLFAFGSDRKLRFAAIPVGLLTMVLSLARSGWLGFVVGLLYLIWFLTHRQRVIFAVMVGLSVVAFAIALQNFYLNKVMTERFETFTDIGHDESYLDRTEGYKAVFQALLDEPSGLGMGAATVQQQDMSVALSKGGKSVAINDSALVTTLTVMGVVGSLIFWLAIAMLIGYCFGGPVRDSRVRCLRAVLVALLAESLLTTVFVGPNGYLSWLCIGLLVSERTVRTEKHPTRKTENNDPALDSLMSAEVV